MEEILNDIKKEFNDKVSIQEKRPGIFQLYLPLYHEDGDMIDIFIVPVSNTRFELCDFGLTLMRLSYSYQIDTPNKEAILDKILTDNRLVEENGNLKFETKRETIFSDIMHVLQVYTKIGSMRYFKREVIESLFLEILEDFINSELQEFKPKKNVLPLPERGDLEADFAFTPNGHPVYLFGVKDSATARLATIRYLEYQKAKLNFRGWVVYDNFDHIPKDDKKRLINSSDKQFTSLDEFKIHAKDYLEREKNI